LSDLSFPGVAGGSSPLGGLGLHHLSGGSIRKYSWIHVWFIYLAAAELKALSPRQETSSSFTGLSPASKPCRRREAAGLYTVYGIEASYILGALMLLRNTTSYYCIDTGIKPPPVLCSVRYVDIIAGVAEALYNLSQQALLTPNHCTETASY